MDSLHEFIRAALQEDVGEGDHTSRASISPDDRSTAHLLVKEDGVIAGVSLAKEVFNYVDKGSLIEIKKEDGMEVLEGDIAYIITCNTRSLLEAERLILNSMQRMSGIATLSRKYLNAVEGLPVTILDTRKTTPLIRWMEKWAVRIGGCENYREGLYDRIMIKDNHIDACGGVNKAIESVRKYLSTNGLDLPITIEVRNLQEAKEVLSTGVQGRIMFDNFSLDQLKGGVHLVKEKMETEASGGVTLATVRSIAETGVDFISSGELTHSAGSMDMSLKLSTKSLSQ